MTTFTRAPHPDYFDLHVLTRDDGKQALVLYSDKIVWARGQGIDEACVQTGERTEPITWDYLGCRGGVFLFGGAPDEDANPCVIRSVN